MFPPSTSAPTNTWSIQFPGMCEKDYEKAPPPHDLKVVSAKNWPPPTCIHSNILEDIQICVLYDGPSYVGNEKWWKPDISVWTRSVLIIVEGRYQHSRTSNIGHNIHINTWFLHYIDLEIPKEESLARARHPHHSARPSPISTKVKTQSFILYPISMLF